MESIWNAQTGALAVERMCWSAVEIACSWKPCSGTHTFERSQWNHIETEALPMNVNHHQVEDLALQNLGNNMQALGGTRVFLTCACRHKFACSVCVVNNAYSGTHRVERIEWNA